MKSIILFSHLAEVFFSKQTDFKQTITEKEIYDALKSMGMNKTPGKDGLSKEFYEVFRDDVDIPLLASINDAFMKEELSTSQKETVIKLIEKNVSGKKILEMETNILAKCKFKIDCKSISNAIERHIS